MAAITAPSTTFTLAGKREMLTAETTTAYFETIVEPEKIEKIVLSTKSFDIDSANIAASYIEKMKALKIADLSDFIAGRETSIGLSVLNIISTALQKTNLVELDLSENALGPRGVEACKPLLASKETLARISFCNDGLSAEACESIRDLLLFRGLDKPTEITHLRFHNNMSGTGGAIAIADVVKNSPKLQLFELSSTRCGREGGAVLSAAFNSLNCPELRSINISDNTFGSGCGEILGKALCNSMNLTKLIIGDIALEDDGMAALLHHLSGGSGKSITELDITCNDVTYEGLLYLKNTFKNHKNLKTLILDDNMELGSRGAIRVSRAISTNIKHLSMNACDMKRDGVNAICKFFTNNFSNNNNEDGSSNDKITLLLNGNRISNENLKLIQDQMKTIENIVDLGSFSDNDDEASDDEEYGEEDLANDVLEEKEAESSSSSIVDGSNDEEKSTTAATVVTTNSNGNNDGDASLNAAIESLSLA